MNRIDGGNREKVVQEIFGNFTLKNKDSEINI